MSIGCLTSLEKSAITTLLERWPGSGHLAADVVDSLIVKARKFSEGVRDATKCSGFYTHFEPNAVLHNIDGLPTHVSVHCKHPELELGAEFILFLRTDGCARFLEATFYAELLDIEKVMSADHAFKFFSDEP